MMCNPNPNLNEKNLNQKSGSKLTGSKSGNVSLWNDPLLDRNLARYKLRDDPGLKKFGQEVARLKNYWLGIQLQRQGLMQDMVDRVNALDPVAIRFVAGWCKWYGYTHHSPALNKIQLLKRGEVIAESTLFEMPKLYEIETTTCCH